MNRTARILEGVTKTDLGIEIAPWFAPLAARRDGYNVRILDVFDTPTLRERLAQDPVENWRDGNALEDVDFVGSATEIATLVPQPMRGQVDYIVSSHNFEHLPNPLKFLQGCATVLRPGGLLSMAVPDRRGCFDFFRSHTSPAEWIEALMEDRRRPNGRQVYDARSMTAELQLEGRRGIVSGVGVRLAEVVAHGQVKPQFDIWRNGLPDDAYEDAHCTVMTPASLEVLLLETAQLGLMPLSVESISATFGLEFYVRLRNSPPPVLDEAGFADRRTTLMRRMLTEYQEQATGAYPRGVGNNYLSKRIARRVRSVGRRLRGVPDRR